MSRSVMRIAQERLRDAFYDWLDDRDAASRRLREELDVNRHYQWVSGDKSEHSIVTNRCLCSMDCTYCSANMIKRRISTPSVPQQNERGGKHEIATSKVNARWSTHVRKRLVQFPSGHDITPDIVEECVTTCRNILESGNELLVTTKGIPATVQRFIHEFGPGTPHHHRVLYMIALPTLEDRLAELWEPRAPRISVRIDALRMLRDADCDTAAAVLPCLSDPLPTMRAIAPLITDSIWVGEVATYAAQPPCRGDPVEKYRMSRLYENWRETVREVRSDARLRPVVYWMPSVMRRLMRAKP